MKILAVQDVNKIDILLENTAICIGKFDGIHRGHRLLIQKAKSTGCPVVMVTFDFDKTELYSRAEKEKLAYENGVDYLITITATRSFFDMTAEDFIEKILMKQLGVSCVVVGTDFRFGHGRSGSPDLLRQYGENYGFSVCVMDKLMDEDQVISSTRIRQLVEEGQLRKANQLLVTPFFFSGVVTHGNQIGRTMAVPTANLVPEKEKLLPPFGVYSVRVVVDGTCYDGVANLGVKPTVGDGETPGLEVWLFDFSGNLYDKEIVVYLMAFQRRERKFDSLEELQKQIGKDTVLAKENLAKEDFLSKH